MKIKISGKNNLGLDNKVPKNTSLRSGWDYQGNFTVDKTSTEIILFPIVIPVRK